MSMVKIIDAEKSILKAKLSQICTWHMKILTNVLRKNPTQQL